MADFDTRRWSLRNPGAEISNNNIPTAMLVEWAERGIIKPGYSISSDGITWVPAETLPELKMAWYVIVSGRAPYGPVTQTAARRFIEDGHFPKDAIISQDPGEKPVSMELPLPIEVPPDNHLQELEEARQKLALLEKELRLKDRRIDELRQEAELRQADFVMNDAPDPAVLAADLEALHQEYDRLRANASEAAEAAAERERNLRQRIHSLEVALETAQQATTKSSEPLNDALYTILQREADILRKSQEEEEHFIEQLRELARQRIVQISERLLEIRRIAGDNPEQMLSNATRGHIPLLTSTNTTMLRQQNDDRIVQLEKMITEARERESSLQRQLVAQEGRETQLRAQIGQAQRQTLDSLKLEEKLKETAQSLEKERAAREEEHRENAHIQAQLLRRIEELERLTAQSNLTQLRPEEIPVEAEPQRTSFGWLKRH
ncbi:MAG: hypothetical protein IJV69_07695 [Kiritimatiellae bacterium]|nr:hypothetical protein [Kiritimatiellia bacterium]